MRELYELAHVITRSRIQSIEVIGNNPDSESKLEEFYQKLLNQSFQDDDEAAHYFYESNRTIPVYKNLKSRLKNRMLNTLFFIDLNKSTYTDWQRAYYKCHRQWALIKILLGKNARTSAISLCHQLLKNARKYEFTELVMDTARILRIHYGTRLGDRKKFREYNELYKTHATLWLAENEAEEYYTALVTEYVLSKADKNDIDRIAETYLQELREYTQHYDSYRLQLSKQLIEMIQAATMQDYERVVTICQKGIQFFEAKPYQATVPLQIFLHQQLVCHIQLGEFEAGQEVAQKALVSVEEGSFNWFKHQELYLLLCLHTKAYQQAYVVYETVINHQRFKFLPENVQELWRIFEAFVQYLVNIGRIETDSENVFRLGRFMNETPIFSQDKRGMNIPILVAQILFMVAQYKYDLAVDRIEAIEKYCSRYLRKDETFRSNCFIKMLLTIPKSSFHKEAVKRNATPFLKKLKEIPPDATGQSYEIEIIPYETLWTFVLESLGNQFHKPYSAKA